MIKHYKGKLGEFDYDDKEFKITDPYNKEHLHYIGKGLLVDLPKGCINTRYMFARCELPRGFTLGNFDTSNVVDMDSMFYKCKIPKGFTLGDKFDTSNVRDMECMFSECEMPEGFTLGDKFNISKVRYINFMFSFCRYGGSPLSNKFGNYNMGSIKIINLLKS